MSLRWIEKTRRGKSEKFCPKKLLNITLPTLACHWCLLFNYFTSRYYTTTLEIRSFLSISFINIIISSFCLVEKSCIIRFWDQVSSGRNWNCTLYTLIQQWSPRPHYLILRILWTITRSRWQLTGHVCRNLKIWYALDDKMEMWDHIVTKT